MANFVAVPSEAIEELLRSKKFVRSVQRNEVVYTRSSTRNPNVHIKVYTSIKDGYAQVRAAGKDAIRVCVVFDDGRKSFGVGKFSPVLRVHSVESVLQRIEERLRQAATRGNEWIDESEARWSKSRPQNNPLKNVEDIAFKKSPYYRDFLSAIGEKVEENGNEELLAKEA